MRITRLTISAIVLAMAIAASGAAPVIENATPVVSPDGSRIAFHSNRDGQPDVYVMSADGTKVTRVTRTPEFEGTLSWSADGKQIRFGVVGKESSRIDAINIDGSNQSTIGSVPGRFVGISDDGKRVLNAVGGWTNVK
ncbi:MAG: TolB family protein, partial [Thermoanaerobaculia bacterium]